MKGSVFEMNRNCTVCNIKIDENKYPKHKTVRKSCYNKNRRKNTVTENEINTTPQQTKIDKINNNNISTYENHACVLNGPTKRW